MTEKNEYSIFRLLLFNQAFDKEAEEMAERINAEIAQIVEKSTFKDKKEANRAFRDKLVENLCRRRIG